MKKTVFRLLLLSTLLSWTQVAFSSTSCFSSYKHAVEKGLAECDTLGCKNRSWLSRFFDKSGKEEVTAVYSVLDAAINKSNPLLLDNLMKEEFSHFSEEVLTRNNLISAIIVVDRSGELCNDEYITGSDWLYSLVREELRKIK